MRLGRWLEYDSPAVSPLRRRHSFYGIAAAALAIIAMANLGGVQLRLIPESLMPLASACAVLSGGAAMFASGASALDQTVSQLFTWIGAGLTAAIPLVPIIVNGIVSRWLSSLISH